MAKRLTTLLDDDAAELLPKLAGSSRKQGEFLSNLIRQAAQGPVPDYNAIPGSTTSNDFTTLVQELDKLAKQLARVQSQLLARGGT
jgi:hypothetical protein